MTAHDDTAGGPQEDQQTHLDTDPVNQAPTAPPDEDVDVDPDHEPDDA